MSDEKVGSAAGQIPIWLMDVDGVLNMLGSPASDLWPDVVQFKAMGFLIRHSPEMTGRILKLHTEGLVEVRWLTTWGSRANEHLSPLFGWPELKVVAEQPYNLKSLEWWKLSQAQELFYAGHRLVWTDDDIRFDAPAMKWLADLGLGSTEDSRMLVLSPKGGLTPADLSLVEGWLKQWHGQEAVA